MPALYKDDRFRYGKAAGGGLGTISDGTYFLTQSGTPDRPIVIKAAGDGEAIFDGDGAHNLFDLMAANDNYFEGLTIRNTEIAFLAGRKNIRGLSRPHDQALPVREHRTGRADRLVGLEGLLHRGQRLHRTPQSRIA